MGNPSDSFTDICMVAKCQLSFSETQIPPFKGFAFFLAIVLVKFMFLYLTHTYTFEKLLVLLGEDDMFYYERGIIVVNTNLLYGKGYYRVTLLSNSILEITYRFHILKM